MKLSRLVKRRTVAQEMADVGAIRINGKVCKPASEVKEGDTVEIAYPRKILAVKVLTGDETAIKRKAEAYIAESEREIDPDTKPW